MTWTIKTKDMEPSEEDRRHMLLSGLMEGHVFIPVLLERATQPIVRCKSRVQEVHLCQRYNQHRDCIDCYHSKRVCRRKNSTEDGPGQYYLGAFTQRNQQMKVHKIIRNIEEMQKILASWHIVQCCVHFCCTAKWFSSTYIYILFQYSFPLRFITGS